MDSHPKIGYCTNVHSGVTLDQVKANLERYSLPVKRIWSPNDEMGIGLWLPNEAATQLDGTSKIQTFKQWLNECDLVPFTFNAFPFSDFHQQVVKHKVYQPTWADAERLKYTIAIANIQSMLLNEGDFGTISTLPLSWSMDSPDDFQQRCGKQISRCADSLAEIHERTGRHIFLCIEPEPGCLLDRGEQMARFFEQHLHSNSESANQRIRDYVGVCHDVCHCAVMFDEQSNDLQRYSELEVSVGKFQISSAIQVEFDGKSLQEKHDLIQSLSNFAEDRYLHQTCVRDDSNGQAAFFEDLPIALQSHGDDPTGTWRVHFHVPIYADQIGGLGTTSNEIIRLMNAIHVDDRFPLHFEIETYAWTVLPDNLQPASLAEGIANELRFFERVCLPSLNSHR